MIIEELINIQHELETERTILKKYSPGDGRIFFKMIQKNKNRMSDSFPIMISNASDEFSSEYFIRKKIQEWDEQSSFNFGIWLKENDNYIGHISIKNIDWFIPRGEIAYIISNEYEGKGFMSEALKILLKFGFETLNMNKLFLRVLTDNRRSFRLAERCGFLREGTLRKDHKTLDGNLVDLYFYGLTKDEYKNLSIF